jgi:hypothetical protein
MFAIRWEKNEDEDLYLPLAQYSYNTMPRPMFQRISSYEVVYAFRSPELVLFTTEPQLLEYFVQTFEDFISMMTNATEATFHMIHNHFNKRQDLLKWFLDSMEVLLSPRNLFDEL